MTRNVARAPTIDFFTPLDGTLRLKSEATKRHRSLGMAAYIHDDLAYSQMALLAILFRELQISFVFSFLLELELEIELCDA